MKPVSSTFRIVFGLVGLVVSAVALAAVLGLIPDAREEVRKSRASFSESVAVQFRTMASQMNAQQMTAALQLISDKKGDVESIGVRRADSELLISTNNHRARWNSSGESPSSRDEYIVPLLSGDDRWGQFEVKFREQNTGPMGLRVRSDVALTLFLGVLLLFAFFFYVRRVLRVLNPARVIPPRVREALDALAEGLIVLDTDKRIALVNRAFCRGTNTSSDALLGQPIDATELILADQSTQSLPWDSTLTDGQPIRGALMTHEGPNGRLTFSVSCVAIADDHGRCRGLVVGFEDVTALKQKQSELQNALQSLRESSDEIRQQNRELEWLATRDGLTGCINRRSFFKIFEEDWASRTSELCAVMVDIDHFKSINDTYGHAMGDEVLRQTAATIMRTIDEHDVVCRYGGEEFSILMRDTTMDAAEIRAEKIRMAIEAMRVADLKVTTSLGVSSTATNAGSPQDLLDQADKCLYIAKRSGRNKVVRFDQAGDNIETSLQHADQRHEEPLPAAGAIPFQAVTALVSAMSYRDHSTASHSRRVADLCVATAEGLLSMRECYNLEIAALLHDIGKIGIPDHILHKAAPLTADEWEIMRRHDAVGVQLVKASFAAPFLTEIMEQHSLWFDMSNSSSVSRSTVRPSVPARILAIADAYDSMTSEATYRKRRTRGQAFSELRRCAGTQFDPELVERFISAVRLQSSDSPALECISTDSALEIGLQIERLVNALDDQDLPTLKELSERIDGTAKRCGIQRMSATATQLKAALADGSDMIEVMQFANELLDLCRMTQSSLIRDVWHMHDHVDSADAAESDKSAAPEEPVVVAGI